MSTALVPSQKNSPALALDDPYTPRTFDQAMTIAEGLASSGLVPTALANKPAAVFTILMTGHELGLSPMQAIRGIDVVEGKARIGSELAVALAMRSPDCEYFRLVETDDEHATYVTKRRQNAEPTTMTYTKADAQRQGLWGKKGSWSTTPAKMLRHRASRDLAHAVYPDVMFGIEDPDEAAPAATPSTVAAGVVAPVIAAGPASRAPVIDVQATPPPAPKAAAKPSAAPAPAAKPPAAPPPSALDAAEERLAADRARGVQAAPASVVGGPATTPAGIPVAAQVAFPLGEGAARAPAAPTVAPVAAVSAPEPVAPAVAPAPTDADAADVAFVPAPANDPLYPARYAQMLPLVTGAANHAQLAAMLEMSREYHAAGEVTDDELASLWLHAIQGAKSREDLRARLELAKAAKDGGTMSLEAFNVIRDAAKGLVSGLPSVPASPEIK